MFLCFENSTIVLFKLQTRWLLKICSHLKWRCMVVFLVQYFHICLLVWPLVGVLCILWLSQIKLYPYLQLWVRWDLHSKFFKRTHAQPRNHGDGKPIFSQEEHPLKTHLWTYICWSCSCNKHLKQQYSMAINITKSCCRRIFTILYMCKKLYLWACHVYKLGITNKTCTIVSVTWGNITYGASYVNCTIWILQDFTWTLYAKVSNSGATVSCNKNVAWLEITMNTWWLAVIMKIVRSINDVSNV